MSTRLPGRELELIEQRMHAVMFEIRTSDWATDPRVRDFYVRTLEGIARAAEQYRREISGEDLDGFLRDVAGDTP